jgi:hypothetical protein
VGTPLVRAATPVPGSFGCYRDAGSWLAQVTPGQQGKVLDMTDWSLFFSHQDGFQLEDIRAAIADPDTRWIVARDAHVRGHWVFSRLLRELVEGRAALVSFPPRPRPGQLQVRVYDCWTRPETAQAEIGTAGAVPRIAGGRPGH